MSNIRPATPADLDAIYQLCCEAHAASAHAHVSIEPGAAKKRIAAYILTQFAFVTDDLSGVLLGGVGTTWYNPEHRVAGDLVFFVREGQRGRGGRRLLREFKRWGKENAHETVLTVSSGGRHAQRTGRFYELMGATCMGGQFLF